MSLLMQQQTADRWPEYHFLLIAPNLGTEWLFDAARLYWQAFRPTIINDLTLIQLLPDSLRITVTLVSRRDRLAQTGVELAQAHPTAYFDPVVYDFFEDTKAELNRRAADNQPFGVPMATPEAGPTAAPVYPTPGPIVTRDPNALGFITQTPEPTRAAPPDSILPDEVTSQGPIYPTPGPIVGGGN